MNLDIKFEGNRNESVLIRGLLIGMDSRIKKGVRLAGQLIVREEKKALKGSNPTTFFHISQHSDRRSRTGALRNSINMQMKGNGCEVGVGGPPARYAAIGEYEDVYIKITDKMRGYLHSRGIHLRASKEYIHIPWRPWFWPTWGQHKDEAVELIRREIMRPVMGG